MATKSQPGAFGNGPRQIQDSRKLHLFKHKKKGDSYLPSCFAIVRKQLLKTISEGRKSL